MIYNVFSLSKKSSQLAKVLKRLNVAASFTFFSYLLSVLQFGRNLSYIVNAVYFSSVHWLLIFFIDYLFAFIEISFSDHEIKLFRKAIRIIALADFVSLFLNTFTGHCFTIEPLLIDGKFFTWDYTFYFGFSIHLFLCYILVIFITYGLISKTIKSIKFYRTKYLVILGIFLLTVTFNAIFLIFNLKLDFSIFTYAFFSITASLYSIYSVPAQLETKMLSLVSDSITDGILCFDSNKKCIYSNRAALKYFPSNHAIQQELEDLFAQEKDLILRNIDIQIKDEIYTLSEEFQIIRDPSQRAIGSFIRVDDITKEIHNLNEERYRSTHDILTGFYNRNNFLSEAEKMLRNNPDEKFNLVCTNIKNFKLVNDLFGTNFGDALLKKQAEMLSLAKFEHTVLGRISGDKFGMLIKRSRFNPDKAVANTKAVQDFTMKYNFKLQLYIGVYEISDHYEPVVSMFDKAALAIKKINEGYSESIAYYKPSLMESLVAEKNIVSQFEASLKNEDFKMYLQPQVSSKDKKIIGAEALVRWIHPQQGIIYPSEFVNILENSGDLYKIDEFIWNKAAETLADWKKRGIDMHIAVNISPKDFYYLDLYSTFTKIVEKYQIAPSKLKLEITETVLMHDLKMHTSVISKLQDYGFCIEMDDFGSGYSSMNLLRNLNVDILKIDMAFLRKTSNIERGKKILATIIKMAKELNMTIITEGVENTAHADFLKSVGCDIFQGYLFSKPISLEDFEKRFIRESN